MGKDGRYYLGIDQVNAAKSKLSAFSSQIGSDPDPHRDIKRTGANYTFLTKAATKPMRSGKKRNVKYVFVDIEE